ncbi:MAG: YCF48-related protein, partial [Terriglobales bacterium]
MIQFARKAGKISQVGIVLLLSTAALLAQKSERERKAPEQPAAQNAAVTSSANEDPLFKGMKYRVIGPFRGGRSLTASGIAGDPTTYYFGATGGGVWKTTDGAVTWTSVFDKQGTSAIGSLAIAPSDTNIVYVGTGEACIRGNISHGDGVYKTLDGGKTWKNVGLRDSRAIGRVIVDPRNADIVFVAALGHPYGPNSERGIFRTIDGGKTWEKVLYKDENTGGIDVAFDPHNSNIIFASLWEARRTPWSLVSGGPGSGLYRSNDGGSTWKRLEEHGLPKGPYGKIGVAVAANSERVYALIEAHEGGLYRSDDGGETWDLVNGNRSYQQRAWYYMHVIADPQDPDTAYVANVDFYKSNDAGRTFNKVKVPHGDNHGMWIDPKNPRRMIVSNDGGVTVSLDGGKTWTNQLNQPTAQFYHVITDNRSPYYVYGAQQDNSTIAIASRSDNATIDRPEWYDVGGGEAGYIAPYPPDPNIVYAGDYQGKITRFDKRTGQLKNITVQPEISDGEGAANLEHRFQWTAPIVISPNDPNTLYHGGERLFKTTDGGMHWEAISPDLTRNDKSKQQPSGGSINIDDTGTEYYDTIFAVVESPQDKDLIWAGTDDGLIHLTRDGGKNWSNVTPKDLPEWSRISLIEASPFDAGTAYVAVDRHQNDDMHPYIYKTGDYGKTWSRITKGIPDNTFVRAVREDPKRRGLLYAGTETGMYVSFNDGADWRSLQLNLPTTPIHDLTVKNDDLVVATHGRSFWILDDLSPLRQFKDDVANQGVYLYTPATAFRMHNIEETTKPVTAGENPPPGAVIYYYVKEAPKSEVTIEILDATGNVARKYTSKKTIDPDEPRNPEDKKPEKQIKVEAGLNRFLWDLRYEAASRVPDYYLFEYKDGALGPLAVPGKYQVRLTVDGKSYNAPLELKLDPRLNVSQADLQKQFDLAIQIRDQISSVYNAVNQVQDVRAQVDGLKRRLPDSAKPLLTAATDLDQKLLSVRDDLIQAKVKANEDSLAYPQRVDSKLASVALVVSDGTDSAPTEAAIRQFAKLKQRADDVLARWAEIQRTDLPAFQKLAAGQDIQAIVVP